MSEDKDQRKEDFRSVMTTESGRRVMYELLERSGLYESSFGNGQTNTMVFNEGGRNQGLRLLADLTTLTPGSYQLMLKENANG